MAFRNKAYVILACKPDILIIPECEELERLSFGMYENQPTDSIWYGELSTKGIGVFTFNGYKIKLMDIHSPEFKYILPLSIYNDQSNLTVFAVWAQKTKNHYNYTEHVWHALNYYEKLLDADNVILAGDFNSNTFWDKPNQTINHLSILEFLKEKKIHSSYHHFHKQIQGQEMHNTFYMYKKKAKPYHLDYCFASKDLIEKIIDVEVGEYEIWGKLNDHVPLTITLSDI